MSAAMPRALPPSEHRVNVSPSAPAREGRWGSSRSRGCGTDVTQGDFRDQLAQHTPSLERAAVRLCRGNRTDAEDLVHEVFEKALRAREQFAAGGNLGGWLYRILVNAHRDSMRRKVTFVALSDDLLHSAAESAAEADDVSALLSLPAEAVTEALHQLPPKLRAPLEAHLQGKRYREIAEALAVPINTVATRIRTARQKLAAVFRKAQSEPLPRRHR